MLNYIMGNHNEVAIRDARISNYVDDNPHIGLENPRKISNDLDISYNDVKNTTKKLKKERDQRFRTFNDEGARDRALQTIQTTNKRLEKLSIRIENCNDDDKLIRLLVIEQVLFFNKRELELDDITIMTQKIEQSKQIKKDEVDNDS